MLLIVGCIDIKHNSENILPCIMMYLLMGSVTVLVTQNGRFLLISIAVPLALELKDGAHTCHTHSLFSFLCSSTVRCVFCMKAISAFCFFQILKHSFTFNRTVGIEGYTIQQTTNLQTY